MSPMYQCPRWERCSAPICPLDPDWPNRKHICREPICHWLKESVKQGGEGVLEQHLPRELAEEVVRVAPLVAATVGDISRRLRRASRQGSRVRAGESLRRSSSTSISVCDGGETDG